MSQIIILGSAFAVPNDTHDNTHLFIRQNERSILVDCAGNPMQHLPRAGIQFDQITDIILTHFHPDHVLGLPLLLMGMWLLGRKNPLTIYGLEHTLQRMKKMLELFDWDSWPDFYQVIFRIVPEQEMSIVFENTSLRVYSSPVKHLIPTIGLRFDFIADEKSVAYSCDTEPCQPVVKLGKDVDILIHEASGQSFGHSSASQAAEVAMNAGAKELYLIHYPPQKEKQLVLLEEARKIFDGPVCLAEDFMEIDL
ncbi:MAG: MBL fold metallo-hydrolase [Anaerolineaceae bacterium]|nr:MBL fold metallo-hydrolase [Anaerolineaceae bacterium]